MRYTLKLAFSCKSGGADWEEINASLIARVGPAIAALAAMEQAPTSFTRELTPQNCSRLAEMLRAAEKKKDKLYRVVLEENAGRDDPGASEWFVLRPQKDMDREAPSKNGLNAIKADRMRGSEQIRAFHGANRNVDC